MDNFLILNHDTARQLIDMFDLIEDVLFWVKDPNGKIIHCNQAYIKSTGLKSLNQVIGKSDLELYPNHIAKHFIADDENVLAGQHITNRIEMTPVRPGELLWFNTSKRALKDKDGNIIGTYGIARNLQETVKTLSGIDKIKVPVEYIKRHFHKEINIQKVAEAACLSVSALERRFKKYLGKTPLQFIREVRLDNARRLLLETQLPISEVAYRSGYVSHSYFSQHFKKVFGSLPANYRRNFYLTTQ